MKKKLLYGIIFLCCACANRLALSQYTPPDQMKWNIDPKQTLMYDENTLRPADLPRDNGNDIRYTTAPTTADYIITPNGVFAVSSSFRLLPGASVTQSELYMTRHPTNPLILYGSSNTYPVTGTISEGTYVSVNGGLTWTGMDVLGPTNQGGDPGPTIDKNGVFIMTHLGFGTAGMFSNRSVDNGATWSPNVTILAGSMDKNLASTDDAPSSAFYGRSYCVWSRFTATAPPIDISYTNDGGSTWSGAVDINVSAASHYSQGCDTRVGPNGEVYVIWANPLASGTFTEDFCGFAKSVNGGVTWAINNNNIFDMNGIRGTLPTVNNIRVNSFPRIDVDRTCGVRRGWIYIVTSQINLAPAGTDADIVLHRSTNGGTTWSAGVRVNQDALNNGKLQYFPCVRVDEAGGVNVFYYDNRNVAAPQMQNYMSRSTDGGFTFTDVKVTDHNFTPAPISGLATGYQGDYMGITSANNKVWCNWMDNSSGIYQSWTASVDYTLPSFCQDFGCPDFPPSDMNETPIVGSFWNRFAPSAYAIGTGSARFNAWSATAGTVQSINSLNFTPTVANSYITFDHAYQPWSGGTLNIDSLIIETSNNGGTTYTILQKLWGGLGANAGPLNTVNIGGGELTPTGSQWKSKNYLLPVGTNKIKFRAVSGFGNDIWIDNLCVQVLAAPVATDIGLASQGMFVNADPFWRLHNEPIKVYLYRSDFPNVLIDSANGTMGGNAVCSNLIFPNALSGTYYKVVKHRNSIETWSNIGVAYTRGSSSSSHNFIQPDGQAYGNNQAIVLASPLYRGMYSGDVDQNGFVDLNDVLAVYNAATNFVTGYVVTDLNGDLITDLNDLLIAYNNSAAFVQVVRPPGAGPTPSPSVVSDDKNMIFENDAMRQKYELTKKLMSVQKIEVKTKYVPRWETKETDPEKLIRHQEILPNKNGTTNVGYR